MFITVNGKILPCERIDQKHFLGHITDEGVVMDLGSIAKKYTEYYRKIKKICALCYKKAFCSQCMFYMKDLTKEVKCPSFTDKQGMIQYVNFHLGILHQHPELYQKVLKEMLFDL